MLNQTSQYDFYKKNDDTLLIVESSYYKGALDDFPVEITEYELLEKYNYKIED